MIRVHGKNRHGSEQLQWLTYKVSTVSYNNHFDRITNEIEKRRIPNIQCRYNMYCYFVMSSPAEHHIVVQYKHDQGVNA